MIGIDRELSKLTITAFRDRALGVRLGSFTVDHNPATISLGYSTQYASPKFIGGNVEESTFSEIAPSTLGLEFQLAEAVGALTCTLDTRLNQLRTLCGTIDGSSKEPNFLQLRWGKMLWEGHGYFVGRMTQMDVRYTGFAYDGAPLHATVSLSVAADHDASFGSVGLGGGKGGGFPTPSTISDTATFFGGSAGKYMELGELNDVDHLDGTIDSGALSLPSSWTSFP